VVVLLVVESELGRRCGIGRAGWKADGGRAFEVELAMASFEVFIVVGVVVVVGFIPNMGKKKR